MIRRILESRLIKAFGGVLLLVPVVLTVIMLTAGRDLLKAIGLSHNVSGAIATVVTVAAIVAGLAYVAIYVIDWE